MSSIPFHPAVLAVCMLSVLTTGCGGSDTNASSELIGSPQGAVPPEAILKIGTVTSETRYLERDGSIKLFSNIYGFFRQYERELTDGELAELSAEKDWETERGCIGTLDYNGHDVDEYVAPTMPRSQSIAAGEVLSVMTPTGSWPDVINQGIGSYANFYEFTDPLPKGSTIHILGADFPQFEAVPIPTVEQLVDVSVTRTEQGRIMPDSAITWRAANDPGTHIRITFRVPDAYEKETFEGTFSFDYNVHCMVDDTGELTFPDSVKTKLREYTATTDKIQMWRQTQSLSRQGDALLWMIGLTKFEQF